MLINTLLEIERHKCYYPQHETASCPMEWIPRRFDSCWGICRQKASSLPSCQVWRCRRSGQLVTDTINNDQIEALGLMISNRSPVLVSVHAYEATGINAIPEAFADKLADALKLEVDGRIVQTNVVSHTGSDGYGRMSRQALFDGDVTQGTEYVLVDDFIGQGGTLANLRGYIESRGGRVIAAVALTGKPYSARLTNDEVQLQELRQKHGNLEKWWQDRFGHTFDSLTQSEARYLTRSENADTIRDRIVAAEQAGNS